MKKVVTTLLQVRVSQNLSGNVHEISESLGIDSYIEYSSSPNMYEKFLGKKLIPDDTWERAAISGDPIISRYWKPGFIKNGKMMKTTMNDYGPDILTKFICDEIKKERPDDQPFFLMYNMNLLKCALHNTIWFRREQILIIRT